MLTKHGKNFKYKISKFKNFKIKISKLPNSNNLKFKKSREKINKQVVSSGLFDTYAHSNGTKYVHHI